MVVELNQFESDLRKQIRKRILVWLDHAERLPLELKIFHKD